MQNFHTSLNDQDLLEVSGEDSEKFLQGQLTCDLARLGDWHSQLGAACNNKGRVYSSFRVLRRDATHFFLVLPPGSLAHTRDTLKKYIPFYKAEMADTGERFDRRGLAGEKAEEFLADIFPSLPQAGQAVTMDGTILLRLTSALPRFELWLPSDDDNPLQEKLAAALPEASPQEWDLLDMQAGICLLRAEDAEQYTPEELSMDLAGFVSWDKGCYTGQEIVARMHYRGKAKKRLFIVEIDTEETITDPTLFNDSGKALGKVFNLLRPEGQAARGLAVLPADIDTSQSLLLKGAVDIPASILRPGA